MSRLQKLLIVLVGLVVVFDEIVKKFALQNFPNETAITGKGILEFAIHRNTGIAFDLPLWLPIVTILTVVVMIGLVFLAKQSLKKQPQVSVAALMVFAGAAGNLFDRLTYGFVVDYLIIPITRSAFNLSDLIIILGLIIFLLRASNKK